MIFEITSAKNPKYKYIKSLLLKKERQKNGEYTVEGEKSVNDAIKAGADISCIAVSDDYAKQVNLSDMAGADLYIVKSAVFPALCETKTPQGILAVIRMHNSRKFAPDKNYVYCDRISDPGNLGTIIRTADAAGFGVLLSPGCAELYNPKTVRASMGSFFHTSVCEGIGYEQLKQSGLRLIAGALGAESRDYREADYSKPCAVIIGNEANGVSQELLDMCDERVIVPIYGGAESLNAAVAAALLMYEAKR